MTSLTELNAATRAFKADQLATEVRRNASRLTSEQRLALAIHLIDNLDDVDDDARNEAVNVLGELTINDSDDGYEAQVRGDYRVMQMGNVR